jgi:hypothetical protein
MSSTLEKIWQSTENNYLETQSQETLLHFSRSVEQRLSVLKDLEKVEEQICNETADLIFERYPKVEKRVDGREKTVRDLLLILRYCGQAMLRDDPQFLENQLLHWLRTMLVAFQFGNNCLADSYVWLDQRCQKHLEPASYNLLKPYLQAVIQIVPEGENRE